MRIATTFAAVLALTLGERAARTDEPVTVDRGAPIDAQELERSIDARAGGAQRPVRVHYLNPGAVEVEVDGVTQLVAVEPGDTRDSTRVVALVVISMLAAPPRDAWSPRSIADDEVPATLRARAKADESPPNWWLRLSALRMDEDDGYTIATLNASLVRRLTRHSRLVGTAGVGRLDSFLAARTLLVPTRVGVEGHAQSAAIELGVQNLLFRETSCGSEWGRQTSLYGAARALIPVGRFSIVAELGGFHVVSVDRTRCDSLPNYTEYGGWFGGGIEWPI